MKLCGLSAFLLFALSILFLGQILAVSEHNIAGIDGLRCDSCGQECSSVCGSRQFRYCCFNYIKKRGDPDLSPSAGQEDTGPDSSGQPKVRDGQNHPSPASVSSRIQSRYFRRTIGDGPPGLNSELPLTLEYPEDPRWFTHLNGDVYRMENDDKPHGSRIRLI